jgi:hypothetical protein
MAAQQSNVDQSGAFSSLGWKDVEGIQHGQDGIRRQQGGVRLKIRGEQRNEKGSRG